ncbi:hypothetical protein M9H77_10551 [Catharanthus roseus]|uniref:Uncharacterized protein n=1 Tax=Catharanthus roseus TaxID=4058 RepID=A0ACC0BC18_CATRO|nr:hypothetical protein M9H77_10551 [Catharanthus roseus]
MSKSLLWLSLLWLGLSPGSITPAWFPHSVKAECLSRVFSYAQPFSNGRAHQLGSDGRLDHKLLCGLTVKPVFHGNPKICEDIEKGLKTSVSQKMMIGSLLLRGSKYR